MTPVDPAERRHCERRQGIAHALSEETNSAGLLVVEPLLDITKSGKRHERRLSERRKANLGPPPSTMERRSLPDLRGVVYPLFYSFN